MYIGSHLSIYAGIYNSLINAKKINASALQIFLGSPQSTKRSKNQISKEEQIKINNYLKKNNILLVVHSPYLLNFCKYVKKDYSTSWAINLLKTELEISSKINSLGCVIHLGSHLSLSRKKAISNFINSIKYILKETTSGKIILETSCGAGTQIGHTIEELSFLYKKLKSGRIGLCVDTCHIFVAGYAINTLKGMQNYFKKFNKLIGIKNITLFHLNDSRAPLGSHLDRHENIGKGYIFKSNEGKKALRYLVTIAKKYRIPMILETHDKYPYNTFKKEIKLIKNLKNIQKGGKKKIDKKSLANMFERFAKLYRFLGQRYRSNAYQNAAVTILDYPGDLPTDPKEILKIPTIGKGLTLKIVEFIKTGKMKKLENMENNSKIKGIQNISKIIGIGPKLAKTLYKIGINNIEILKKKLKEKKIKLTDQQILGLKHYKDLSKKIPRSEIKLFEKYFNKIISSEYKFNITGSYRRLLKETGDIDILLVNKNIKKIKDLKNINVIEKIVEQLKKDNKLVGILASGKTKLMCLIKIKNIVRHLDIIFVPMESYYTALVYFTGSKEFNIKSRRIAKEQGYTLNQYGLFKGKEKIPIESEKSLFNKLGIKYLKPKDRK